MSPARPAPRPRRRAGARSGPPAKGALRVVAGSARGLRLDVPPGDATRPTADRVRQATFNALESIGAVADGRVLDAFAGSGALGIEALSRGAAHVTFADLDAAARATVATNLTATGLTDRAAVTAADGATPASAGPWDLVLLDPPYGYEHWDRLLAGVARSLADDGVVVIESDRDIALPADLRGIRTKRYGGTVVTFATSTGSTL